VSILLEEGRRLGNLHTKTLQLLHEVFRHVGEHRAAGLVGNRAGGVFQQDELLDVLLAELRDDIANRVGNAMRQSLASDENHVGLLKTLNERRVDIGGRVARVGNVRLDDAVVLRERIAALRHEVNHAEVLVAPVRQGLAEDRMNRVTRRADKAVRWPDDEHVTSARLEGLDVIDGTLLPARIERLPLRIRPGNVVLRNHRERGRMIAVCVNPENRVGDVNDLVRVKRDANIVNLVAVLLDHCGQASHVLLGTLDVKGTVGVTEINLRVDNEELDVFECHMS
jgi:hypothetical protein